MIKLNKNLEYALMALSHLCSHGDNEPLNVKTLAQELGAPFDPLSRVMQSLKRSQFVNSVQGVTGGYTLVVDLKTLTLNDLIQSLQGPVELVKCISSESDCSMFSNCEIKAPLNHLNNKLINFYKTIDLYELLLGGAINSSAPQKRV